MCNSVDPLTSNRSTKMAPIGVFLQDARYAVRTLVKMPGFTATCVICLGLGIGVNSTMFSVVDTVAIRPLPFADPDRLVELHTTNIANGTDRGSASYLELQDWKERTHSFASVVAFTSRGLAISDGREPERFIGALITWDLFPTLGIQPILGRQFRPEEDQPGAPPVVLLSHGLWERRYAADPDVIGRSVTVNGQVHTVVGVMPPRFQFPELAQLWLPLVPTEHSATRADRTLDVIARLKSGVGLVAARQDLKSVADQLAKEHTENVGRGGAVETFYDALMPSDIRLIVFTMMGAVTLVLLIACANVANLLLARATSRQREIAVRAALGAGRRRIVGQLLTESAMLGLVSVPLGAFIAFIGLRWLTSSIPPQNQAPYYIDWSMNPRVILYTAAIALVTSVIFGLAPAIQAVKANLQDSLRDGRSSGGGRNRLRSALVSVEIALALILLVGASLFVRSFLNLERARAGLDASGLLVLRFYMVNDGYQAPDAQVRLAEDVVRRVESIPGVVAVMASNMVPYVGGGSNGPAIPEGVAIEQGKEPNVLSFGVTRHWLRALNVPLVAGRDFTETEGSTRSSVAIVNQVFAQRLWPTSPDPVGKRFRIHARSTNRLDHGRWRRKRLPAVHRARRQAVTLCVRVLSPGPISHDRVDDPVGGERPRVADVGGPAGNPQVGPDLADLQRAKRRRGAGGHVLGVPVVRLDVLDLRRDCAGACVNRGLRRPVVHRVPTRAGDRCPHGPGRQPARCVQLDPPPRDAVGRCRHPLRRRGRGRRYARGPQPAVQRQSHRCPELHRDGALPGVRGAGGELPPGAARHRCGSDDDVAGGMKGHGVTDARR